MNVKDLINELQRMPMYAEVYLANHDNADLETSGDAGTVCLHHQHDIDRANCVDSNIIPNDVHWVTIRG